MVFIRVDSCCSMDTAHTGFVSFWSASSHRWVDRLGSYEIWWAPHQLLANIPQPVSRVCQTDVLLTFLMPRLWVLSRFPRQHIRNSLMFTCWVCLQVNHSRLPLQYLVDTSQHHIKLFQVNVLVLCTGHCQHASSTKDPQLSTMAPLAKELASNHTVTSCPFTPQTLYSAKLNH